MQVSSAER
ncbi:hypothetical protein R3I93_019460 [Phoxinus phoxinus]|uniref:Uncharacterized protein n=1 Tax=Phoxinus phoxinus TaxID=58324 RepID=A0AAN9CDP1_9TELE